MAKKSSCAAAHVRHRACDSGLPHVVCDPRGNSSRWMVRATRSEARALVPGSWLIRRLGRIKVCTQIRARTLPGAPPQREQRFPRVWSAPEAFTRGISLSARSSLSILVKWSKNRHLTRISLSNGQKSDPSLSILVKWSKNQHLTRMSLSNVDFLSI